MGFQDIYSYVVYDNPLSKGVTNATKSVLSGVQQVAPNFKPSPQITVITKAETPLWELAAQNGPFVRLAGVLGASAVILGAYGAHKAYPKDKADELKKIYETANKFHFIHSLAMLGVPLCRYPKVSGSLLLVGTVFFAGPCYYHAFTGENKFGKLAPIGGSILILGWLAMVL